MKEIETLILVYRYPADSFRKEAERMPGTVSAFKATAKAQTWEAAAIELEETIKKK